MLQIFADASVNWQNTIFPFALNLFKLLAVVDFAWTYITVALEKSAFQALVAPIIKKLMTIGMFYALLVFAPTWFPKIHSELRTNRRDGICHADSSRPFWGFPNGDDDRGNAFECSFKYNVDSIIPNQI